MAVIFLFIDGVGLGSDTEANPFIKKDYDSFLKMSGGQPFTRNAEHIFKKNHLFKAVDATLGVEGLPQSGTGQAALFSGENAAKKINRHFGPFPHSGVKELLDKKSLFNKVLKRDKSCHFINAYPRIFFEKSKQRNRWSCTTLMTKNAGLRLNTIEDIKKGQAITAGIIQRAWKERLQKEVPLIEEKTAAERLLNAAEAYDLVLYEYYLTDKAGHSKDPKKAEDVIQKYDRFLDALIDKKKSSDTLILCSDHGNVEDLSVKTHTLNKVPLFVDGPGAGIFRQATSIMDVTPGIVKVLSANNS